MGMTKKAIYIMGVAIPDKFAEDLDLSKAYAAGVLRTRNPERLEKSYALRDIDNEFNGRTHEILVEVRSAYEYSKGSHFIDMTRAYSAGYNIDRQRLGKFDPQKLTNKRTGWSSSIEGTITSAGLDTVDILNHIEANPQFIPEECWGDEEENPHRAKLRDKDCLSRSAILKAKIIPW
jgi:hypothetical protein